jgi:hypothetical protein
MRSFRGVKLPHKFDIFMKRPFSANKSNVGRMPLSIGNFWNSVMLIIFNNTKNMTE